MLSSLGISFSIAVFFTTLFERFYPRHRFNMPIRSAQKPYMQVFACLIRQLISLPSIYYYYLKFSSLHLLLLYSVFKVLFSGILLPFSDKASFSPTFYSSAWWAQMDSNHRPHAYQACALTTWAMRPFFSVAGSRFLLVLHLWWRWGGSNSWPPACRAGALPAELHPLRACFFRFLCFSRIPFSRFLFTETFKIEQCFLWKYSSFSSLAWPSDSMDTFSLSISP